VALAALVLTTTTAPAVELKVLLPQARTAFQTNEWIDVSVLRRDDKALPKTTLSLKLAGTDGSAFTATFPLAAVALKGNAAVATEHLHLNGWLLRPGKYQVQISADGASASADLEIHSHVRKSSFRLINWGRANKPPDQLIQGEDSLGFNLVYGGYVRDDNADLIRAGVDYMANCVMSGGHQMDLRQECDWSDPLVTRGGTRRVVRRAFIDRGRPNVPGVHFYDEPGLTWEKNEATGENSPHGIKSQVRSYQAAFDREPIPYQKVDPKNPEDVERWRHWARWKLGFMDAAWREAQFGVSQVRPDYLSLTQSQYGFTAFTDGYYFNVARSLPITSGHGGYHDFGPGYFNPSYFLEMARARDLWKPCWYLPTWYGNTTSDQFRLEQYLSFQTGIQGLMSPPDLEPASNPGGRQGIVETNHLLQRLGPIFTTMAPTKPPVAMLYSLSQAIHTQTRDRSANYAHGMPQGKNLPLTYLAGKLNQQSFLAVVDEDIVDGTLAADHKAVVLTSIDYLDPQVVEALEVFIRGGGKVLLTGDSSVAIKGAVKLDVLPRMPDQEAIDKLMEAKKYNELGPYTTTGKYLQGAAPLAKAIKAELDRAGIGSVFESDVATISATRQAAGDIEYLFAVNASFDDNAPKNDKLAMRAVDAVLSLPGDGRPVYDALIGGLESHFRARGDKLTAQLRFGPGQMRVFARTARPIGGIKLATPVVQRELVLEKEPIRVEIGAALVDSTGGVLSGSAPLQLQVIDPLGAVRHELYPATKLGMLRLTLPLAANDPAGKWTVAVREMLAGTEDRVSFTYTLPPGARSLAGATPRAVYAVNDRDNIFRFARLFHDVTIVKGTSPWNEAAAQRLIRVLQPWGVRCKVMDLAEASKARNLTAEEVRTWSGLNYTARGSLKPGNGNPPAQAGFAVQGPVLLLGSPEDNPILKTLLTEKFLPYTPVPDSFPGRGRGMLAWQRDAIGPGQESVALIAHDEAGMAEAVGSFYEAVAGMDPLTRWEWPRGDSLTPANKAEVRPAAKVAWQIPLNDRVEGFFTAGTELGVITHDGSLTLLEPSGKVRSSKVLAGADLTAERQKLAQPADADLAKRTQAQSRPDRLLKLSARNGKGKLAVAYWGGTVRVVDGEGNVRSEQRLPQDVTALIWSGNDLIAGLADGRVLGLHIPE